MRVKVDRDKCCGSGQCTIEAPEVFDQDETDGIVILLRERPAPQDRTGVLQAVRMCPTETISVVEE
jgi:ferredoxin